MANLKYGTCAIAVAGAVWLASAPLLANPTKPATPKASTPKTTKVTAPKTTKASVPKTTKAAAPQSAKAAAPKVKGGGSAAKAPATASSKSPKAVSPTGTTTSQTPGAWEPNNPVAKKLSTKPNLLSKVESRLPHGIDLNAATADFKNFGQFIAAVNVSNNLGIPFGDLKAAMTGTTLAGTSTGEGSMSLGRAIQELKPSADAETEAAKALSAADAEIAAAPAATTASSSPKKQTKKAQ